MLCAAAIDVIYGQKLHAIFFAALAERSATAVLNHDTVLQQKALTLRESVAMLVLKLLLVIALVVAGARLAHGSVGLSACPIEKLVAGFLQLTNRAFLETIRAEATADLRTPHVWAPLLFCLRLPATLACALARPIGWRPSKVVS